MTLNEFVIARNNYCQVKHSNDCLECKKITSAANLIMTEKVVLLKNVYEKTYMKQGSRYKTDKAVERLMQLPVVIFPIKIHQRTANLYVAESHGVDVLAMQKMVQRLMTMQEKEQSGLSKETLSFLCELATSEKDKKLIKYTALASSGASGTQAKKMYGISDPSATRTEVEEALDQVKEIHHAVNKLASVQEKCILESLGIVDLSDESESGQESSGEESDDLSDLELDEDRITDV